MPLSTFMTATATTTRVPAISNGIIGDPVTHLESVAITPPMLPSAQGQHSIRQAIGLDGTAVQIFEAYTESHTHTDGGSKVTQLPDIVPGDRLTVSGVTYNVRWSEKQPPTTSYGETLLIYMTEDKRL